MKHGTIASMDECDSIEPWNDTDAVLQLKIELAKIGIEQGYVVKIEEPPTSIYDKKIRQRLDVQWIMSPPEWLRKLSSKSTEDELIIAAFEIEGGDPTTKYIKADIMNISRIPVFGFLVIRRSDIYRRAVMSLEELQITHGYLNVEILSFEDIRDLAASIGLE